MVTGILVDVGAPLLPPHHAHILPTHHLRAAGTGEESESL